jgi:hypothetical protein
MATQARYELVGNKLVEELREQRVTLRPVETEADYHDEAVSAAAYWLRGQVWRREAHDGLVLFFPVYALGRGEVPAHWRLLPMTGVQLDAERRVKSILQPVVEAIRHDNRALAKALAERDHGDGTEIVRVLRAVNERPTCVRCDAEYDHGCNSDFCSSSCETAYVLEAEAPRHA